MKERFKDRAFIIARYIIESGATVRDAAKKFGVSKSTVHKDVTSKLRAESPTLYEKVRVVLEKNKAERHIRGGDATKRKYIKLREKK